MSEMAEIGGRAPIPIDVEAGKSYWWCACGRSAKQPFCDGSHKVTSFTPIEFKAAKSESSQQYQKGVAAGLEYAAGIRDEV